MLCQEVGGVIGLGIFLKKILPARAVSFFYSIIGAGLEGIGQ